MMIGWRTQLHDFCSKPLGIWKGNHPSKESHYELAAADHERRRVYKTQNHNWQVMSNDDNWCPSSQVRQMSGWWVGMKPRPPTFWKIMENETFFKRNLSLNSQTIDKWTSLWHWWVWKMQSCLWFFWKTFVIKTAKFHPLFNDFWLKLHKEQF